MLAWIWALFKALLKVMRLTRRPREESTVPENSRARAIFNTVWRMPTRPRDVLRAEGLAFRPARPARPTQGTTPAPTHDSHERPYLDHRLPPEIIEIISDYLRKSDINNFRAVCTRFQQGAYRAWCRSIDQRSFPVTCQAMQGLLSNAATTGCGFYMRTLRVDINLPCQCRYVGLVLNSDASGWPIPFQQALRDDSWGFGNDFKCGRALRQALRYMPNLDTIEMCLYRERTAHEAYMAGGFLSYPTSYERSLLVPSYAARLAFDVLAQSLYDCSREGCMSRPRIKTLTMPRPIPLESLPAYYAFARTTQLFDYLTSVNLTIAPPQEKSQDMLAVHGVRMDRYLPRFLATLPSTMDHLSIVFPKASFTMASALAAPPTFGNIGFDAMVEGHLQFPSLLTLHFANLVLTDSSFLAAFLSIHADSLRHFKGTNLALSASHWRPFINYLGTDMKLDKLEFESDMTEAEKRHNEDFWRNRNPLLRPSAAEYMSAAKSTSFNGVKLEKKRPEPRREESGYSADEESNAETIE